MRGTTPPPRSPRARAASRRKLLARPNTHEQFAGPYANRTLADAEFITLMARSGSIPGLDEGVVRPEHGSSSERTSLATLDEFERAADFVPSDFTARPEAPIA